MINARNKINPKEIPGIAKRGKRLTSELFDIRCWWNDTLDGPKFAFAVGLKVSKSAVIRNTIKRKFRAAVAELVEDSQFSFRNGKYLIVAKSVNLKELKSGEISSKIKQIFT